MNQFLRFAPLALALLAAGAALAADASHAAKKADGGTYQAAWWESLASCTGKIRVLSEWATEEKRPEAAALQNGSNVLWTLAISRLVQDRGIGQDEAQKLAVETVRSAAQLQQQGIMIYKPLGQMEDEFKRQIDSCNALIGDYAAAFPGSISQ